MIRMQTMARIVLIALGIHTCIRLVGILPGSLFALTRGSWEILPLGLVGIIVAGLLIAVTIKLLILNSSHYAQRIVPLEPPPETLPQMQWLTAVFRLICIGAGIFYLVRFADGITREINILGMVYNSLPATKWEYITGRTLAWLFSLPITVYLLFGAPHFVSWQVKKTLDICKAYRT